MLRSQKFFRVVWRINSLLILLAAGAVILLAGGIFIQEMHFGSARNQEVSAGVNVNNTNPKSDLVLNRASLVRGTQIMRAELQRRGGKIEFSSGSGYSEETRNILFIEPGQTAAHWLLSDNDHVIETTDIDSTWQSGENRVVATAALVKSSTDPPETAVGRLLLFDPPGRRVVAVADGVRAIQIASISSNELSLLYERNRQLFLDVFDAQSIVKLREQKIEIPEIK